MSSYNGRVVKVEDEKLVRIMPLHAKRDFPGLNLPCAREAGKIGFDCFKLNLPSLNLKYSRSVTRHFGIVLKGWS